MLCKMKKNASILLLFLAIPYLAFSQNVNINVHFEGDCMKMEHGFTDLVIEIGNQSDKTAWIKYSNIWTNIENAELLPEYQNVLFSRDWIERMSPEDDKKTRHDWIKIKGSSNDTIRVNTSRFDILDLKPDKDYTLHCYYVKSGKRKDRNADVKCYDLIFQMCAEE